MKGEELWYGGIKHMVKKYSFWKGVWKAVKNNVIVFLPAILAFMANVPVKYTPIASIVVYLVKNWYEVSTGKKVL